MYIAIDIGGTNTRIAGAVDLRHIKLLQEPIRRHNGTNYHDDIQFIVESVRQIAGENIEAVGIGVVGELSEDKSTSLHSKNNSHWNGQAFVHDLSSKLGCPVFADNDGVAAALGEAYYGSLTSDFAYIIWGTGIGGALVTHDSQHKPSVVMLDWQTYFKSWEYRCGGSEIAKQYNKRPEDFSSSEWQEVLSQFRQFVIKFANTIHPPTIVYGGGLSVHHRKELETLSRSIGVPSHVTSFGGDSGIFGGFAVIRQSLGY